MPAISVLLVEDEALISMLVSDALSEPASRCTRSPPPTRRSLSRRGGAVDVLFTDINLPGGMNGAELARRARALSPDCRWSMPRAVIAVRTCRVACRIFRAEAVRSGRRVLALPASRRPGAPLAARDPDDALAAKFGGHDDRLDAVRAARSQINR